MAGFSCSLASARKHALSRCASGDSECTHAVVTHNAVEPLVRLLSSASPEVVEQPVWCLGNIAGDSPDLRDV